MNFAIDYDGCADSDIQLFRIIITQMKAAGNKVYIVTMRYPSECAFVLANFQDIVDGVIPTSRMAKRKVVENHGIEINVWMDDNPRAIDHDASAIWGQASPEGAVVVIDHDQKTETVENVSKPTSGKIYSPKLIY